MHISKVKKHVVTCLRGRCVGHRHVSISRLKSTAMLDGVLEVGTFHVFKLMFCISVFVYITLVTAVMLMMKQYGNVRLAAE